TDQRSAHLEHRSARSLEALDVGSGTVGQCAEDEPVAAWTLVGKRANGPGEPDQRIAWVLVRPPGTLGQSIAQVIDRGDGDEGQQLVPIPDALVQRGCPYPDPLGDRRHGEGPGPSRLQQVPTGGDDLVQGG